MTSSTRRFVRIIGAAGLALSLALTGCGAAETSATEETEQEEKLAEGAEEAVAIDSITIPDEIAAQAGIARGIVEQNDTSGSEEFATLPTVEDEQLEGLARTTDISIGLEDVSKAPSGTTILSECGVQMQIPASWLVGRNQDGYVMQSPDGNLVGYLYGIVKPAGNSYDVEAMAQSIPVSAQQAGYSHVKIVSQNSYYSMSGDRIVGAHVCFTASYGSSELVFYNEYVESSSYLNCIEFVGTLDGFYHNIEDISAATGSISYVPGEEI